MQPGSRWGGCQEGDGQESGLGEPDAVGQQEEDRSTGRRDRRHEAVGAHQ